MNSVDRKARRSANLAWRQIGNLHRTDGLTKGYITNSDGSLFANAAYSTSGYIPVTANAQYYIQNCRSVSFYDANKTFVAGSTQLYSSTRDHLLVRAPFGAAFIRYSSTIANMDNSLFTFMAVKIPSKWVAKIYASYGDSITQQEQWQSYLVTTYGLIHYNYGVGGTKVTDTGGTDTTAMCRDERINSINASSNVVTFMGGTNDWLQNVSLGTISDTGTNTFYGAVKKTLEKLVTRFPTARIIAMTTPYGKAPNRAGWSDTYGLKNNLGLTTYDYGRVIKEVAGLYGIPCIDIYQSAGWNDFNITSFCNDDGALIHPNSTGGRRIAECMIDAFRNFEPVL